jgi:hypothetical protein
LNEEKEGVSATGRLVVLDPQPITITLLKNGIVEIVPGISRTLRTLKKILQ